MTARTFKSRLFSGVSSAFVCSMAVAGFIGIQAVTTQASASLNGALSFDGTLGGSGYVGASLKTATDIILSPLDPVGFALLPVVPTNGIMNNFYSPSGLQDASNIRVLYLSNVSINTGFAGNSMPVVDSTGIPLYSNFLTFSFTSSVAGTVPNGRFTYDISDIVWEAGTKLNTLNFFSTGFIGDSGFPGFSGQQATLSGSFSTHCVANTSCNTITSHFEFETLGDGHYQNIPEPVSMSLLGIGIAGLVAARRRRI